MKHDLEGWREQVGKADALYRVRDFDGAITLLQPMVAAQVPYFRPYYNMGFFFWLKGDVASAIPLLTRALSLEPEFVEGQMLLAKALVSGRAFPEGLVWLDRYETAAGETNESMLWKARALWGCGDATGAAAITRRRATALGWTTPAEKHLIFAEEPWFLNHIGNWTEHLASQLGCIRHGLEIGCMEGMSAIWTIENLLTEDGVLDINDLVFRPNFRHNIASAGVERRIRLLEGSSAERLPKLQAASYDFVYVDGEHSADGVFRDCLNALVVAEPDAMIVFDDYGKANEQTSRGIDLFLEAFGEHVAVVHKQYQIILRRRASDVALTPRVMARLMAAATPAARASLEESGGLGALRSGAMKIAVGDRAAQG
jgi:predicted O-methyltransferase YrrM